MNEAAIINLLEILAAKKALFWDKQEIDPSKDGHVIAERILEFGTEEDVKALIACYGEPFIINIIRDSRALSPKTVNYYALRFHVQREETRCFSDASHRIWQPF